MRDSSALGLRVESSRPVRQLPHEPQQDVAALGIAQVERNCLLIATEHQPPCGPLTQRRAHVAGAVSLTGPFDLDHLGAEVGEVLATLGPATMFANSMICSPSSGRRLAPDASGVGSLSPTWSSL